MLPPLGGPGGRGLANYGGWSAVVECKKVVAGGVMLKFC